METYDLSLLKHYVPISSEQEIDICTVLHKRAIQKDGLLRLREDDLIIVTQGLLVKIDEQTGKGQHFIAENDIAIYPPLDSPYYLQSIEASRLQYIHHEDVLKLIDKYPHWQPLYYTMLRFWSYQRIYRAKLLELPAVDRKEAFYRYFKDIAHRIPYKYIASYLNITPSYFSQL